VSKIESPKEALAAIADNAGVIMRRNPDGEPTFVAMATRLEKGLWASVADTGAFGGTVRDRVRGTAEIVDLFLHTLEADPARRQVLPIRWASRIPIRPVMLIGVPGDEGEDPQFAPSAEMAFPEYQHVHRPAIAGDGVYSRREADFSQPVGAEDSCIMGMPMMQHHRHYGRDQSLTICVHADMGRPTDTIVGGPVVDGFGRIVGVILGADMGGEQSHWGSYVPVDFLTASIENAKAAYRDSWYHGRHWQGVDRVSHESSDVYWDDEDRPQLSHHRLDQMLKVVMKRDAFRYVLTLALSGVNELLGRGENERAVMLKGSVDAIARRFEAMGAKTSSRHADPMIPVSIERRFWKDLRSALDEAMANDGFNDEGSWCNERRTLVDACNVIGRVVGA
jgi:hypothetical protein